MHKEHSGGWKSEVEVTELGQEKQRVTDPNAIGERGGTGSNKDGERRTDRERARDAVVPGDPRESPKMREGRRSVGGKVADAPGDLGPKWRRRGRCQETKGFQRMKARGHGQVDGCPGRKRTGYRTGGLRAAPGPEGRRRMPVPAGARRA